MHVSKPVAIYYAVDEFLIKFMPYMETQLLTACMPIWERFMLRKRSIIETIIDQLKNISQMAHSRHRSLPNLVVNLMAGITAYSLKDKKPSITNINMVDLK